MRTMAVRGAAACLSAALVVACAAACSPGGSPRSLELPATVAPTPAATGPTGGLRASTGTGTASARAGGAGGAAVPARCGNATLAVGLGKPFKASVFGTEATQYAVVITFRNHGRAACEMFGFPGATLTSASGDTYDLPRRALVAPAHVVVPPGSAAAALLFYLQVPDVHPLAAADPAAPSGAPAPGLAPFPAQSLLVTPPDERDAVPLAWPGGPVVDQRHADYPGSYIAPVTR